MHIDEKRGWAASVPGESRAGRSSSVCGVDGNSLVEQDLRNPAKQPKGAHLPRSFVEAVHIDRLITGSNPPW